MVYNLKNKTISKAKLKENLNKQTTTTTIIIATFCTNDFVSDMSFYSLNDWEIRDQALIPCCSLISVITDLNIS